MRVLHKVLLNLSVVASLLVLFYSLQTSSGRREGSGLTKIENWTTSSDTSDEIKPHYRIQGRQAPVAVAVTSVTSNHNTTEVFNIWCIFTKVTSNAPMKYKFQGFVNSLVKHSSVNITLHIIIDKSSKVIAQEVVDTVSVSTGREVQVLYYSVNDLAEDLEDIILAMQPHFSSQPGTYYSDALFFLSLGLHRIAINQQRAAMFDADVMLRADIADLFKEFDRFGDKTLFGLAPELSPVYRHALYIYRSKNINTKFGEPASKGGFSGLNSGVVLFRLDRMRESSKYNNLLQPSTVKALCSKYSFKGHLGDQDFYTLMGMEHPELVHLLPCGWNRQLCTWWRDHGYRDVFEDFFRCSTPIRLYHGNCNSAVPLR